MHIEVNQDILQRKKERLLGKAVYEGGLKDKAFYRRISEKYGDQSISTINKPNKDFTGNIADALQAGWADIFKGRLNRKKRRKPAFVKAEKYFETNVTAKVSTKHALALMAPISKEEIEGALKSLAPGKAPGPDLIGTDFYHRFSPQLIPFLLPMFNSIMAGGMIPLSFKTSKIFPLKNAGDSPQPLNYRPISLLNSDYKLLNKVLASRVNNILPTIISSCQSGFVKGRRIAEPIHLIQAVARKT